MKIVHLNTHSYGGAAVVARRLHCAALACGIESQFITQYGIPGDSTPHYAALHSARLRYFLRNASADRRLHRVGRLAQQWTQHRNLAHRPAGFEIFSPLNDHPRYSDCTHGFDPDIIHLHWVSGFVDHAEFFQRNRDRKFVWTLHDMNPFTGGCHHSDGCLKFTSDCRSCPQLAGTIDANYAQSVLAAKRTWLSYLADDQLTIVSPSKWLLDLSRQSSVSARFRHEHIENPALAAAGPAESMASARAGLRLPSEKKVVLFVADNLRNPRKGFELLFDAVRLLPRPESVQLVGVGQRADAPRGLAVTWAGRITDEAVLARYYRSADLVVSPSLAENSPLVVVEALQQGTPVVAFDVGGVGELVPNGSGVLAGTCSAASLAEAMQHALYDRSFSRGAIAAEAARFAPQLVLEKYRAVYAQLMAA